MKGMIIGSGDMTMTQHCLYLQELMSPQEESQRKLQNSMIKHKRC